MSKFTEIQPPVELPSPPAEEVRSDRRAAWTSTFWQFVRFSMVGVLNTVLDICTLNVLLWLFPTHNATLLLAYNSLAYTVGAVNSFCLNKYWTFRRRQRPTGREVLFFIIINLVGIITNDTLFWGATHVLHPIISNNFLWVNASKAVAVVGTALISYLGMRLWVFSARAHAPLLRPSGIQ